MTRGYARACGGQRVAEGTPQGHWKVLTILSALSLRGLLATMTIEEATDGDIFLAYVEPVLCPALQPGDVVVMDNLSAHKVSGVRELIQAVGAELLYLPPYSPDLNPIELVLTCISQSNAPWVLTDGPRFWSIRTGLRFLGSYGQSDQWRPATAGHGYS